MQEVLAAGRSAIMLVPEIGLTPQAAANLHEIFGEEVAILHSALSRAERAEQWHRIRNGEARVVVGTRSAVFAPVRDLALIVVDEEQDSSYKQEEMPRYHGRDVAIMRGKLCGAAVVLGTATPAMEIIPQRADGQISHCWSCRSGSSSARCRRSSWWTCAPNSSKPGKSTSSRSG